MYDDAKTISKNELASSKPSYLETIFSLANGHFGIRSSDPVEKSATAGTIVNGFFEKTPITYGEKAYGYAENNQTIVLLPDFRAISIFDENDKEFNISELEDENLYMDQGVVVSVYKLSNDENQSIELTLESAIQQNHRKFLGLRYKIRSLSYTGKLRIIKHLNALSKTETTNDPRKSRQIHDLSYSKFNHDQDNDYYESLWISTKNSRKFLTMELHSQQPLERELDLNGDESLQLDYIGAVSDIDENLWADKFPTYEDIVKNSTNFWTEFWHNSEIEIFGDESLNKAIHYNLFQLMSSAGRDGKTSIPAKGLSGTGYEGHYFWDTEMYMSPFFIYTNPDIAKQLIKYRYSVLDSAKKRARTLGVDEGALFSWRTIDGSEVSAYFPAGTAQYHIDADIAYSIYRYYRATGDTDFIGRYGLEIVLETARFWKNFGAFSEINGEEKFCFFDVTGPDEYTAIVNNNYYTNRMAKFNLEFAVELISEFPVDATNLGVTKEEKELMKDIAQKIYLPFDKDKGINQQDDSSFKKPIWPFETTPKDNYPLLLHYHPLNIYRYQVNKQADTLLADYLFNDISEDQLTREYAYYERITTHDSSLSRSIFSALAARIGFKKKAYSYFMDTAKMDLIDLQKNTDDGLHTANLGGSWLTIISGFAGLEVNNNQLVLENRFPDEWEKLVFRLKFQNRLIKVTFTHGSSDVSLLKGKPIKIIVNDIEEKLGLKKNKIVNANYQSK